MALNAFRSRPARSRGRAGERRRRFDRLQQGRNILAHIVIDGAGKKLLGVALVMLQGRLRDFFYLFIVHSASVPRHTKATKPEQISSVLGGIPI
jgi:hypothetical protein